MGTEFERFLHAPIGEDRNGALLTVLSALARLDIDPWEEAAALARLPVLAAVRELALLLVSLPERPMAAPEAAIVAVELVALLPHRLPQDALTPARPVAAGTMSRPPVLKSLILYLIMMLIMVTCEWLAAGPRPATAPPAAVAPAVQGASAPPYASRR